MEEAYPEKWKNPMHVAYVDDDELLLLVARSVLEADSRFTVRCFHNPVEAARAIPKLQPDVILVDLNMPEMSGAELLAQLRSNSALAQTAMILVTATGELKDCGRFRTLGADGIIEKPFDPSIFIENMMDIVNKIHSGCA